LQPRSETECNEESAKLNDFDAKSLIKDCNQQRSVTETNEVQKSHKPKYMENLARKEPAKDVKNLNDRFSQYIGQINNNNNNINNFYISDASSLLCRNNEASLTEEQRSKVKEKSKRRTLSQSPKIMAKDESFVSS